MKPTFEHLHRYSLKPDVLVRYKRRNSSFLAAILNLLKTSLNEINKFAIQLMILHKTHKNFNIRIYCFDSNSILYGTHYFYSGNPIYLRDFNTDFLKIYFRDPIHTFDTEHANKKLTFTFDITYESSE